MDNMSGIVDGVFKSKIFGEGKSWGPKIHLDIKIQNKRYRLQFQDPNGKAPVKKGDTVEIRFKTEVNGEYTNNIIEKNGISIITPAPLVPEAAKPTAVSHDSRQQSIVFQSSLKVAIEVLKHNKKPTQLITLDELMDMASELTEVAIDPASRKAKVEVVDDTPSISDDEVEF